MNLYLPIFFAAVAAFGNAIFALGQKRSIQVENGLLFISISTFIACLLALCIAPLIGEFSIVNTARGNWKALCLSGTGLFFTLLGFNLLYSRYGVSHYALYAVLSIISTTILVGVIWLKESVNGYHMVAISLAVMAVVLFSIGQSKL